MSLAYVRSITHLLIERRQVMIKDARLGKELLVTVVNKIGILAEMSRVLADDGLNIEAVAGYAKEGNQAEIILIADDNVRARDALVKKGYKSIQERQVVIVNLENKPGTLKDITAKLAAEGIDIKYIYGTTCSCSAGCPAKIILSTSNNEKAFASLKK